MTFIFFQQKTAYEMRISDWSSDVCSSDLWKSSLRWPAGLPVHDCPPPKAALASWLKAYGTVEGGNYGQLLLEQQAESDDTLLSALRQNGRAACRERVGQYGELSVVAVSLIKTRITKKNRLMK